MEDEPPDGGGEGDSGRELEEGEEGNGAGSAICPKAARGSGLVVPTTGGFPPPPPLVIVKRGLDAVDGGGGARPRPAAAAEEGPPDPGEGVAAGEGGGPAAAAVDGVEAAAAAAGSEGAGEGWHEKVRLGERAALLLLPPEPGEGVGPLSAAADKVPDDARSGGTAVAVERVALRGLTRSDAADAVVPRGDAPSADDGDGRAAAPAPGSRVLPRRRLWPSATGTMPLPARERGCRGSADAAAWSGTGSRWSCDDEASMRSISTSSERFSSSTGARRSLRDRDVDDDDCRSQSTASASVVSREATVLGSTACDPLTIREPDDRSGRTATDCDDDEATTNGPTMVVAGASSWPTMPPMRDPAGDADAEEGEEEPLRGEAGCWSSPVSTRSAPSNICVGSRVRVLPTNTKPMHTIPYHTIH